MCWQLREDLTANFRPLSSSNIKISISVTIYTTTGLVTNESLIRKQLCAILSRAGDAARSLDIFLIHCATPTLLSQRDRSLWMSWQALIDGLYTRVSCVYDPLCLSFQIYQDTKDTKSVRADRLPRSCIYTCTNSGTNNFSFGCVGRPI